MARSTQPFAALQTTRAIHYSTRETFDSLPVFSTKILSNLLDDKASSLVSSRYNSNPTAFLKFGHNLNLELLLLSSETPSEPKSDNPVTKSGTTTINRKKVSKSNTKKSRSKSKSDKPVKKSKLTTSSSATKSVPSRTPKPTYNKSASTTKVSSCDKGQAKVASEEATEPPAKPNSMDSDSEQNNNTSRKQSSYNSWYDSGTDRDMSYTSPLIPYLAVLIVAVQAVLEFRKRTEARQNAYWLSKRDARGNV